MAQPAAISRALWLWFVASTSSPTLYRCASHFVYRVKLALRKESSREWHEVEADFLESDYRDVRDRQMEQLELEDDLLSKIPVRYVVIS